MKCKHCQGDSRVLKTWGRERLRECTACRRRWRSVELLQGFSLTAMPATAESVVQLRSAGKAIRDIAEALQMSTRSVQGHLQEAQRVAEQPRTPDIVEAWK